jgi:ABC-type nitrate/sulfonate/bicarbonate transport system substrate-binding protein
MWGPTSVRLAVVLALAVGLMACAFAPPPPTPTPIALQLRWTHQAQSAGFYAAEQRGFYAAEGLAVTFLEGGPQVAQPAPVLEGRAQFGVLNADALIAARAAGKPVRAIATIYRRNPIVYMALASAHVASPRDFVGKTIQVAPPGRFLLQAVAARVGVRPDQYTAVNLGGDIGQFYDGRVQVWAAFLMNEPVAARAAGHAVSLIYPDDYGVHFYADTLYTTVDLLAAKPELVTRFLRASLRGWAAAVERPDEVAALVRAYKPDADPARENAFLAASLPLINTGQDRIGWMRPEVWAGMEQTLREQGVLTTPLDVIQVYTLRPVQDLDRGPT